MNARGGDDEFVAGVFDGKVRKVHRVPDNCRCQWEQLDVRRHGAAQPHAEFLFQLQLAALVLLGDFPEADGAEAEWAWREARMA